MVNIQGDGLVWQKYSTQVQANYRMSDILGLCNDVCSVVPVDVFIVVVVSMVHSGCRRVPPFLVSALSLRLCLLIFLLTRFPVLHSLIKASRELLQSLGAIIC